MTALVSMVSAYILVQPPGIGRVEFPYNPDEYTVRKDSEWHASTQPAAESGPRPQFHGTRTAGMDVKILLDTFSIPPNPPQVAIAILQEAMQPIPLIQPSKPPFVTFGWGPNIVLEQAYIKSVSVTYKRFLLGVPVRAEVTVSLEEVPLSIPGTNPTSGGIMTRKSHTVVEGDTLASIAWAEFGDATKWRALAEANDIDDPMRLTPGQVLLVPDPGEIDALA